MLCLLLLQSGSEGLWNVKNRLYDNLAFQRQLDNNQSVVICPPTYHNRAKCFFFFYVPRIRGFSFQEDFISVIKRCFHGLQNVAIHNFRYTALGKLWQNLHSKGKLGFSIRAILKRKKDLSFVSCQWLVLQLRRLVQKLFGIEVSLLPCRYCFRGLLQ